MPIYAYRCSNCQAESEVKQGFNDPSLTECEHCKGKLIRIISPVGVIFKGSGFHITDYKNKSLPSTSPAAKSSGDKETPAEKTKTSPESPDNSKQSDSKPKTEGEQKN
jgi:putative FmdB family regulatory protein